jgi:pimeloyl-ACP methyl ester carboxylesterase
VSTFVLIHGGGDVGWYWHLVEAELRGRGHDVVAPDLPGDDDTLELEDYAGAVVAAVGDRRDLVVVGHSFGTMFFADPAAAFGNIARAARAGARLIMMVWQSEDRNEWATAIRRALRAGPPPTQLDTFSLANAPAVESLLAAAGFTDVAFADVREPIYFGSDASAALELVRDMKATRDLLARLDSASAQHALNRLRATLAAHQIGEGVLFESRAWIITARRAGGSAH